MCPQLLLIIDALKPHCLEPQEKLLYTFHSVTNVVDMKGPNEGMQMQNRNKTV